MLTIEKNKKYTVDDYMLLDEGAPFQLINFDLIMSPSPIPLHQFISGRIVYTITAFLESKNIDEGFVVSAPMDIKFDEGNVLQPDVLYIAGPTKDQLAKDRIEAMPDLVVEILSPSNAYYDLRQKKDIYEKYGVKEYIIIDPIAENADLYALKEGAYYLHQKASKTEILYSVVLHGLQIELLKLFR
jgi:Uma2 family endonuclease